MAPSVCATCGVPLMLGGASLVSGRPATVAVSAPFAVVEPPAEVAVTLTATVEPTSAAVRSYVAPDPTCVQLALIDVAAAEQRCQA